MLQLNVQTMPTLSMFTMMVMMMMIMMSSVVAFVRCSGLMAEHARKQGRTRLAVVALQHLQLTRLCSSIVTCSTLSLFAFLRRVLSLKLFNS